MGKKNLKSWRKHWIRDHQLAIKKDLDQVQAKLGVQERLHAIIQKLRERESDFSSSGIIKRYVLCMSALVHHLRHGGLSPREIKRISEVASGLLRSRGIGTRRSQLAYLYGDLHQILAQIYQKAADYSRAGWHQTLAHSYSRAHTPEGNVMQSLAIGVRKARVGQTRDALALFCGVEKAETTLDQKARARMERARLLRLSGKRAEARELVMELLQWKDLPLLERREAEWELLCLNLATNGDFQPLFSACQRRGTHHGAIYILEAFFWSRIIPEREFLERFSSVGGVAWNMKEALRASGPFFTFAQLLTECYDVEIPLAIRVQKLEAVVIGRRRVTTLEKELQLLAAFARFLLRSKAHDIAAYFLSEYRALSLTVSEGKNEDALGVMGDVLGASDLPMAINDR